MLKKRLFLSLLAMTAVSSANSAEQLPSQNEFIDLMKCMDSAPVTKTTYKGIGFQQVVMYCVLNSVNQQKQPSIEDLKVDYSKIYQLVVKYCPKELGKIKQSLNNKAGNN